MHSQATVRPQTKSRAVLRWDHTLQRGGYKVEETTNPLKFLMWEPSQATLDKDMNSWCCMLLRVLRLFGVRQHLRPSVRPLWWKGSAPGCAHAVRAQRYQACPCFTCFTRLTRAVHEAVGCFHGWIERRPFGPELPSSSPCSQAPARLDVCGKDAKVLEGHEHSCVPTTMYGLLVSLSLLCLCSFPSSGAISVKSKSVFMSVAFDSRNIRSKLSVTIC